MKKNLSLTLALLLALCLLLTACGGDADVTGQVTPQPEVSATVPSGNVEPTEPPVAATAAPEPTVPETAPPEPTAAENELSLGRMEGGVYTNAYVGYACNLDSDWTFLSAVELEQIPAGTAELISGTELGEALANVSQFTDMMAENVNDLTTMNVLYQKLDMPTRLAYMALTEEEIIDASIDQMDMLVAAYEQAGFTVDSIKKVTVTFLGEERTALHSSMEFQGVPYFTLQFFDYHLGEYSVVTTLASYVEDRTASLMELFYSLG